MPIRAYILINTDPGKAKDVAKEVGRKSGSASVKKADAVTGRFDVIAEVEADDYPSVGSIVLTKIATVSGVRRTETAFVV